MNVNLKDLALEAKRLKQATEENDKEKMKKEEVKKKDSYALTLTAYPDIIITKETSRMTKSLIILVSAGTAFIKTAVKGKEPVSEILTEENYRSFSADMPDIALPEGSWTRMIVRGTKYGRALVKLIEDELLCEMIRKKALPDTDVLDDIAYELAASWHHSRTRNLMEVYKNCPTLYMYLLGKEKSFTVLVNEDRFTQEMYNVFGLDVTKRFFDEYEESLVWLNDGSDNSLSYTGKIIPAYEMKASSFIEYVLYTSYRMGYGDVMRKFFVEWQDTLRMQENIYGKIREKYPKDLPLLHNQLAFKSRLMQEEIDEKLFAKQAEAAKVYEGSYKDFVFIAPSVKQDFYDEATAQANCLASYIKMFINGDCIIIFMRKKKSPEESYITVEIREGLAVQAKLAQNRSPHEADMAVLREWVDKCNRKKDTQNNR